MKNSIPVDDEHVVDDEYSSEEYRAANESVRAVRERLAASPKARAAYERTLAEGRIHQANLAKLRKARALAQKTVGELMGMNQSEVSRLEHRSDLLISTLRKFVEATGGELMVVAHYPDGDVEVLVGEQLDAAVEADADRTGKQDTSDHLAALAAISTLASLNSLAQRQELDSRALAGYTHLLDVAPNILTAAGPGFVERMWQTSLSDPPGVFFPLGSHWGTRVIGPEHLAEAVDAHLGQLLRHDVLAAVDFESIQRIVDVLARHLESIDKVLEGNQNRSG